MTLKLALVFTLFFSLSGFSVDLPSEQDIKDLMLTEGLTGWVHGINPENGLKVFTLRNPDNFFEYKLLPMIPVRGISEEFNKLVRHDKIWIKGLVIENEAPIQHLVVKEFKIVEKFIPSQNHKKRPPILGDYPERGTDLFKIHGTDPEGKFVLLEKENDLIPLFIQTENEIAKSLFRNDIIELSFIKREKPSRGPMHFELDTSVTEPIQIVEKIVDDHGELIEIEGSLVQFEKSPQIKFDIYALRDINSFGFWRNYTLVNFTDPEVFKQLREKAAAAWAKNKKCRQDARNSQINNSILVKAKGLKNVVSANQANPQILLESADDLTFKILNCTNEKETN